jgi:hypothetical protein
MELGTKERERTLVNGAIVKVITAFDTSAVCAWLDEFDVVVVSETDTSSRVSISAISTAGVVLSSTVVGIQSTQ